MAAKNPESAPSVERLAFNAEGGIADIASKQWFFDIGSINPRFVAKFGFPDEQRHALFLLEAIDIIQSAPPITLRDNVVVVPSGLSEFKATKARFQRVMRKVDDLSELLFALRCDATSDILLSHFDDDGEVARFAKSLPKLMGVLAKIDALEGAVGNRPTGEWVRTFLVLCQRFWASEKGGGTRIIFQQERRTRISYWVEDVYEDLRKLTGSNTPLSKVKTIARNVPAYRQAPAPINGSASDKA